ncbi:hypothetical protein IP81_14775 [Novosphingobium sp. AAP83]|uniref:hypothetical protein n=1 Tax=Novosphingobium sp. AAP83 TaxID=1523425 RepID=UPI0006BA000B|nr:hypothetical protein [Novosphingobium sp. AAP83]KPF90614.1 hypothetical protein IP81_14775 [Novosphingobium sp. AAP83]
MELDIYYRLLPNAAAVDATRALEAFCNPSTGLKAYSTAKHTADFRVRLWPRGRVMLTAYYQSRAQLFLCQAYCLPHTAISMGIPADRVKGSNSPLRSEIRLTADEYVTHLQALTMAAAASWQAETG